MMSATSFIWAALGLSALCGLYLLLLRPRRSGLRRYSTEEDRRFSARVDDAMGLVELPPIRVTKELAAVLEAEARGRGLIVQAHVRDLLTVRPSLPSCSCRMTDEGWYMGDCPVHGAAE